MKEIIELNGRLLREAKEYLPKDGLMLERNDVPEELARIPSRFVKEIDDLRARLNSAVANDFDYMLVLGDEDPCFDIEYHNGQNVAFGGNQWKDDVSIFDQIREIDWDSKRTEVIQRTESFDAIIEIAKELPVMIPSTKHLQKHFPEEVKAYIKEKRRDASAVHVLQTSDGEELFDVDVASMEDFTRQLPDVMTHQIQVITVVAEGKPLPAVKIDALKKAALKRLEDMPISHAKASGKYAYIMAMAAQGEEHEGGEEG